MIETIMEKGKMIKKPKDKVDLELSLKDRYDLLREKMNNSISQLENYLETYQQYQDLHKSYQDTQKQLWDKLSTYTGIFLMCLLINIKYIRIIIKIITVKLSLCFLFLIRILNFFRLFGK